MNPEPRLRITTAVVSLVMVVVAGIVGLMIIEHWSFLDAAWVTIVSLTTTGYGDLVPASPTGRIFLMILLIAGVGVVAYGGGALISYLLEMQVASYMEARNFKLMISAMRNHIVICGGGRVGTSVAEILAKEGVPFVIIDENENLVKDLRDRGWVAIVGDATKDEVLLGARIQEARGIVSALSEDAYNVFVTLTAKALKPALKVVARAERPEAIEKLKRAGADKVVAPALLSGQHMANAMLKPVSVELVETLFSNRHLEIQMEELRIQKGSPVIGKELKEAFARKKDLNVMVVAIIRDDQVMLNPTASEVIREDDTLVVLGSKKHLELLELSSLK